MQGVGVGPFTLSMAFRLTVMAVVVAAETIQKGEMAAIRSPLTNIHEFSTKYRSRMKTACHRDFGRKFHCRTRILRRRINFVILCVTKRAMFISICGWWGPRDVLWERNNIRDAGVFVFHAEA